MTSSNFAFLHYPDNKSFLCLGNSDAFFGNSNLNWPALDSFLEKHKHKFIVGLLAYDVKNAIERLDSQNKNHHDAPDWLYFVPNSVYLIEDNQFNLIFGEQNETLVEELLLSPIKQNQLFELNPAIDKAEYIHNVQHAKEQIQQGNCYELNFCQNFESFDVNNLDTWSVFRILLQNIQAPFSAYLQWNGRAMMGASPERFIKKTGKKLISQPIKGTRPRMSDLEEDEAMIRHLLNDPKERAENVMIVDLVRNDLARVAKSGTIRVDELFGIYSFQTVHQMISTISCELRENIAYSEIIKALFPMGSMTGAPKVSAMRIIESLESFKRGWYSGSIGLIHPNGDFDKNVVIRTFLYNQEQSYLCCPVGSAITILSDPEAEYKECLVKINRILDLFR
jgi:para-aminobenzoate synthetase component 1